MRPRRSGPVLSPRGLTIAAIGLAALTLYGVVAPIVAQNYAAYAVRRLAALDLHDVAVTPRLFKMRCFWYGRSYMQIDYTALDTSNRPVTGHACVSPYTWVGSPFVTVR